MGTVAGMWRAIGRGASFTVRYTVAVAVMLVVGLAQAPALLWYAVAAAPACGQDTDPAALLAAQVGMVSVGVASALLAVVLAVAYLRLRWGWLLWWVVPVVSLAAPAAALYLLPVAVPAAGGMLCH